MVVLFQISQEGKISVFQNELIYFDSRQSEGLYKEVGNTLSCFEKILKKLLLAKRLKIRISQSPETVVCVCKSSQLENDTSTISSCKICSDNVLTDNFDNFLKEKEKLYLQRLSTLRCTKTKPDTEVSQKKRSFSQSVEAARISSEPKRNCDSGELVKNAQELLERAKRRKDKANDLNECVLSLIERAITTGSLSETERILECLSLGEDKDKLWDENLACLVCLKCLQEECSSRFFTLILRELLYPQMRSLNSPARRDLFEVAIESAKKFPNAFTEAVLLNLLSEDQDSFNLHKVEIIDKIVKECLNKITVAEMVTEWIRKKPNTLWSEAQLGVLQTSLCLKLEFSVPMIPEIVRSLSYAGNNAASGDLSKKKALTTVIFTIVSKYKNEIKSFSPADLTMLRNCVNLYCAEGAMKKIANAFLKKL